MAHNNQSWEDLGQSIQNIIDRAVSEQDFGKLNQTISQVIDRAVDAGGEAVRRAMEGRAQAGKAAPVAPEPKPLPVLYGKTGGMTAKGIGKLLGGSLITLVALAGAVSGLVVELLSGGSALVGVPITAALAFTGGGIFLLGSGIGNLNRVGRFKAYRKTLGTKTHCTLEKLAQTVGKSEKFVRREVQKMIRQGLFLQGHLDKEQTRLITSHETYRQFEHSRLQLEQRQQQEAQAKAERQAKAHTPQVQEVLDKGDAFLEEIRRCNDAIPGQEISAKISRMELIVQRIFDRAENHPEIVPDLKKMMDYYLPMTVKLLNAYADMDAQPVQGQNIQTAKREIEGTLDTLNLAFEKLLDSVFADTALDVSSDISVLHTLLAQEGLTEDGLKL